MASRWCVRLWRLSQAGAVSVGGDLGVDLEGEGGAAGLGVDAGLGAGLNGVEEVFEFQAKGFAFGDAGFGEVEAGGGMCCFSGGRFSAGGHEMLRVCELGRLGGCAALRRLSDGGGGGRGWYRGREW